MFNWFSIIFFSFFFGYCFHLFPHEPHCTIRPEEVIALVRNNKFFRHTELQVNNHNYLILQLFIEITSVIKYFFTLQIFYCISRLYLIGRLAQLVEHLVYTERVIGSSPLPPTIKFKTCGGVAQLG